MSRQRWQSQAARITAVVALVLVFVVRGLELLFIGFGAVMSAGSKGSSAGRFEMRALIWLDLAALVMAVVSIAALLGERATRALPLTAACSACVVACLALELTLIGRHWSTSLAVADLAPAGIGVLGAAVFTRLRARCG